MNPLILPTILVYGNVPVSGIQVIDGHPVPLLEDVLYAVKIVEIDALWQKFVL